MVGSLFDDGHWHLYVFDDDSVQEARRAVAGHARDGRMSAGMAVKLADRMAGVSRGG